MRIHLSLIIFCFLSAFKQPTNEIKFNVVSFNSKEWVCFKGFYINALIENRSNDSIFIVNFEDFANCESFKQNENTINIIPNHTNFSVFPDLNNKIINNAKFSPTYIDLDSNCEMEVEKLKYKQDFVCNEFNKIEQIRKYCITILPPNESKKIFLSAYLPKSIILNEKDINCNLYYYKRNKINNINFKLEK